MAAVRDRYVWDIAQGKKVPATPDDSETGELYTPPTRFGQNKYSESPDGPRILSPDDFIKTCSVPPGFEIKLFADEKQFPELAKPVQLGFDGKGRLWVATMPTYPMWKPGQPKPSDKLLILEDTDGDGKADKCTTFYDKLHCPTGFEFWNGGVLVVDQPRLIFLKDTDRDDKADEVVHLIDGWATQDTHHTINAFEFSPGGLLYMLEGVSMSTTVETPWGPFRNFGSSGSYVLDPRTLKVRATSSRRVTATRGATSSTNGAKASAATAPAPTSTGTRPSREPSTPAARGSIRSSHRRHASRRRQRVPGHLASFPTTCRVSSSTPA